MVKLVRAASPLPVNYERKHWFYMPGLIHAESCLIIFYTNAFLFYVSRHYLAFWKIEAVLRAAITLQSPLLAASAPVL